MPYTAQAIISEQVLQNEDEWRTDANILKKQVQYARKKSCDGFAFFDYQDLKSKKSAKAVKQLKKVLKY